MLPAAEGSSRTITSFFVVGGFKDWRVQYHVCLHFLCKVFLNRTSNRHYRYQHKITGKRTSKPLEEICGGILADEMGLGKTLMVLSAILKTLNQSHTFRESCAAAGNSQKRLSRATLVIAPSVCQCVPISNISNCNISFNIISEMSDDDCSASRWLDG